MESGPVERRRRNRAITPAGARRAFQREIGTGAILFGTTSASPRGTSFLTCPDRCCYRLWHCSAGPAEVSFAGTFAVGSLGSSSRERAKFRRSSSFSRSRLSGFPVG